MDLHAYVVKYSVVEKSEKERSQNLTQWTVTGNDFLKGMLEEAKVPNRHEVTVIVAVGNARGINVSEKVIEDIGGVEKAEALELVIVKTVYIGKLLIGKVN